MIHWKSVEKRLQTYMNRGIEVLGEQNEPVHGLLIRVDYLYGGVTLFAKQNSEAEFVPLQDGLIVPEWQKDTEGIPSLSEEEFYDKLTTRLAPMMQKLTDGAYPVSLEVRGFEAELIVQGMTPTAEEELARKYEAVQKEIDSMPEFVQTSLNQAFEEIISGEYDAELLENILEELEHPSVEMLFADPEDSHTGTIATEEQQKILAFSAIMKVVMKEPLNTCPVKGHDLELLTFILQNQWGITDQASAQETLEVLTKDEADRDYSIVHQLIERVPWYYAEAVLAEAVPELVAQSKDEEDEEETFSEIIALYDNCKKAVRRMNTYTGTQWEPPSSLMVWDCASAMQIAYWSMEVGYITEEYGWKCMRDIAEVLKTKVSSWKDFAEQHLFGRHLYGESFEEDAFIQEQKAIALLLTDPNSPWIRFPL